MEYKDGFYLGHHRKQKLTLTLSKEVIDKAKAAGINISALTEQVLKAYTYEPVGYSNDDFADAYDKLFMSMKPVLHKYDTRVTVGQHTGVKFALSPCDIYWYNGRLLIETIGSWQEDSTTQISEVLPYLYDPPKILENLIKSLIRAAERNKDKVQKFKFASRFLRILSEDEECENKEC